MNSDRCLTSTAMLYVLKHLCQVHPQCRTMKELSWWFIDMDCVGKMDDLKVALNELKRRHLVRYEDPKGWTATA